MADSTIRQGLRLLKAGGFSSLPQAELLEIYFSSLDEIKRREGSYRLNQETLEGEMGMLFWEACETCNPDWSNDSIDSNCKKCSGDGMVHLDPPDLKPFYSNIEELGGHFVFFERWDPQSGIAELRKAIKQLGGDVFEDPLCEGLTETGLVVYVPQLIRNSLKEKENSDASNSDLKKV